MKKLVVTVLTLTLLVLSMTAVITTTSCDSHGDGNGTESSTETRGESTGDSLVALPEGPWGDLDPDDTLSLVEAIAMASYLNASYQGVEISNDKVVEEIRYDFDDASILHGGVGRYDKSLSVWNGNAKIKDGMLIVEATGRTDNPDVYDTQIVFTGWEMPAKDYNKITFRMKRDVLPNADPDAPRDETIQLLYSTSSSAAFSEDKSFKIGMAGYTDDPTEWFEVVLEVGRDKNWRDIITNFRVDPTNNNGIYYLDYLVFSKSDKIDTSKWYDPYIDYALANGIIDHETYQPADYNRDVTRFELFELLGKAVPATALEPINAIQGIPDVSLELKDADAYLMFYNAGITLGIDTDGNFDGDSVVKVSDAAAIIDRIEHPENRLKSTLTCDWSTPGHELDMEFEDNASVQNLDIVGNYKLEDGTLVIEALDGGANVTFDSQICLNNLSLKADDFYKLRVRMKADLVGDIEDGSFDFFFKKSGSTGFDKVNSISGNFVDDVYVDIAGWYIIEINLFQLTTWEGTITAIRFDPGNTNGTYTIDYIRLFEHDPLYNASHEELINNGYVANGMLQDPDFENGFVVTHYEQKPIDRNERVWNYDSQSGNSPLWDLQSMWTLHDLWDNRDTSLDKYTLADTLGINTVIYNPLEKSLSLRLNATNVYNGEPHGSNFSWWPHLLINQSYETYPPDKEKTSAAADRIFVELDMRVTDFKPTTNKKGTNSCIFPLFFYLTTDKAPTEKIWFGISLFHYTPTDTKVPAWAPDSAANQFMFGIPPAVVFGGLENSFNPKPFQVVTGEEWKHIRVDITELIDQCLEWANRDKAFGYGLNLTKEDMYFGGCNIGFEIHGNFDCTIEIKNLDMIAYNKT